MANFTDSMKEAAFATNPREFDLSYSTTLEEIMEKLNARAAAFQMPFKLKGGVNKGHPTEEEIEGAVSFYRRLATEYGEILEDDHEKRMKRRAYEEAHPRGGLWTLVKNTAKGVAGKKKG